MAAKRKESDITTPLGDDEYSEWSPETLTKVKAFVKQEASKRSPERVLKNELLSIKYQMEEYIEDKGIDRKHMRSLEMFLNYYLKALNLTTKKFAQSIDTTDGNLKKYVSGERKFNVDLAMKFANFFHTTPDVWLKLQLKNELLELAKEKAYINKYKKYDYEKVVR